MILQSFECYLTQMYFCILYALWSHTHCFCFLLFLCSVTPIGSMLYKKKRCEIQRKTTYKEILRFLMSLPDRLSHMELLRYLSTTIDMFNNFQYVFGSFWCLITTFKERLQGRIQLLLNKWKTQPSLSRCIHFNSF